MPRVATLTVDVVVLGNGDGVPVVCLVGVPGHAGEIWVYRSDRGWRPLWPTRGLPAVLPERPTDGVPALGAIATSAFPELMEV